jgi:predicted ribosome quality control (RQC) complex YloA/Tae2 family protein
VNRQTLEKIRDELAARLVGQKFGKIFPLARLQLAIDFRLHDSNYLFIGVEPNAPRIYLIKRRVRDLEKLAAHSSPFVLFLRKRLANAVLQSVAQIPNERILRFAFEAQTELGETENYSLIVQLTGRSSNLFLLDKNDFVLDAIRETFGEGQEIGSRYAPPASDFETQKHRDAEKSGQEFTFNSEKSLSKILDESYLEKDAEQRFQARAKAAAAKLKQEIGKREKLVKKLKQDLANHGDAEKWKRSGDLILANLSDAVRLEGKILVVDYFDENIPTVEIEADENDSLTAAAEKFFRRYTKARNAREEISKRFDILMNELDELNLKKARLDEAIAEKDDSVIDEFTTVKIEKLPGKQREKHADNFTGARRFTSSEGYEILVGKASKDNDFLTFRVAKASDLWMHAADYPGSHVVVRNPNRQEIPPKTLLEAAQIAAFYSHAREQPKVAVHYTPKKFVNKPKGAVAGLVSLSGFKTILVEPKVEAKNEAEK